MTLWEVWPVLLASPESAGCESMTAGFIQWNIPATETLGEKLKRFRMEKGFTLEFVSCELRIPKKYLEAIESNAYGRLPGRVYAESFLRSYARLLRLHPSRVVERFHAESQIIRPDESQDSIAPFERQNPPPRVWMTPTFLRSAGIGVVVLIVLSYIAIQVNHIIAPPRLEVHEPGESVVTTTPSVMVIGKTEPETHVAINGQEVDTARDGSFQERVDLKTGVNIVKISAARKHSKETVVYKRILVERSAEVSFHP